MHAKYCSSWYELSFKAVVLLIPIGCHHIRCKIHITPLQYLDVMRAGYSRINARSAPSIVRLPMIQYNIPQKVMLTYFSSKACLILIIPILISLDLTDDHMGTNPFWLVMACLSPQTCLASLADTCLLIFLFEKDNSET